MNKSILVFSGTTNIFYQQIITTGNSTRCLQFCEELVERFNFHHFDNLNHSETKIDPRKSRHEVHLLELPF